jgi:hypothetical protein
MRKRSPLLIFPALLVMWGGCVDTVEPTGPGPTPPDDGGGEITAPTVTPSEDASSVRGRTRQITEQLPPR